MLKKVVIIIISVLKKDTRFNTNASLPFGPLVKTNFFGFFVAYGANG